MFNFNCVGAQELFTGDSSQELDLDVTLQPPQRYVLEREIPMAWGTTTDSYTPEINLSQYAIEIKTSNTKGSNLVPYSGRLK